MGWPVDSPYELVALDPEFLGEELGQKCPFQNSPDSDLGEYWRRRGNLRIPYLNERAREHFKVHVVDGRLCRRISAKDPRLAPLNVTSSYDMELHAYVMDAYGAIYLHWLPLCRLGRFHLSGLVAGAPVAAAGRLKVYAGHVHIAWSGTFQYPTGNIHLDQFRKRLRQLGADLYKSEFMYSADI